jgi:hypothetical protein
MNLRALLLVVSGAVLGVTLVLSCSGGSNGPIDAAGAADAAGCTCPPAEPPLMDRIVRVEQQSAGISGGGGSADAFATCPIGSKVLGGSCLSDGGQADVINQDGIDDGGSAPGWKCMWTNNGTSLDTGTVTAICLTPAPGETL